MYNNLYNPAYAHTPSDASYVQVTVNFLLSGSIPFI